MTIEINTVVSDHTVKDQIDEPQSVTHNTKCNHHSERITPSLKPTDHKMTADQNHNHIQNTNNPIKLSSSTAIEPYKWTHIRSRPDRSYRMPILTPVPDGAPKTVAVDNNPIRLMHESTI